MLTRLTLRFQSQQKINEDLTRRATFTLLTKVLEQLVGFLIQFFITPIVVVGLGSELYGAWLIIQQSVANMSRADLRPMGALRVTLGTQQHQTDLAPKRRQVGAALLVWLAMFPILLLLGGALVEATPTLTKVSSASYKDVQIAMALAVLGVFMARLLSDLPNGILTGVNLYYRGMGLNALTLGLMGMLNAVVIWFGWGITGLAVVNVLGVVLSGLVRFIVAKSAVSWLGISIPTRDEFFSFLKLSLWLFLIGIGWALLYSSDLILVGVVLGSSSVTIYAMSGALQRILKGFLINVQFSASPGIAAICGQKDWKRLITVRAELYVIAVSISAIVGTNIIALNRSFLQLWVQEEYFAGQLINVLLVLVMLMQVLLSIDSSIVESMLRVRAQMFTMLFSGIIFLLLGLALSSVIGLTGFALAMLVTNLCLFGSTLWIISSETRISVFSLTRQFGRLVVTTALLFTVAFFVPNYYRPTNWLELVISGLLISVAAGAIIWTCGFSKVNRSDLKRRFIALTSRQSSSIH